MTRETTNQYIYENFGVNPEYPWARTPNNEVFRHGKNRKWFAIIMDIPENKVGRQGDQIVDVMNVKCDQDMIFSLLETKGYYPAYHMNKSHWISIVLDDELPDETVKNLIDLSFDMTKK